MVRALALGHKIISNNHVEVAAGTTCWTLIEWSEESNWQRYTNENRGYDQKGYENNVTVNTEHNISRQMAADSYSIHDC